jgi:hypothetical protein
VAVLEGDVLLCCLCVLLVDDPRNPGVAVLQGVKGVALGRDRIRVQLALLAGLAVEVDLL